MSVKVENRFHKVNEAGKRADFFNLGHAGAVVRKVSTGSIRLGKEPSAAGSPPHTKGKGKSFKKGILYAMEGKDRVLIGTSAAIVGESAKAHEFGGRFKRNVYAKRPFMNPALGKVQSQIPGQWADSYRE